MIDLIIQGHTPALKRSEVKDIVHWMASKMKINRYRNPVTIYLQFKKNLKKRSHYRGSAIWEDTNHRPREFTVEVDAGMTRLVTIRTILHEMTHVKQYAKGELKDLMKFYSLKKWKTQMMDENRIRYRDQPWEKEAYRAERIYYRRYVDEIYNNKKCR